MRPGHRFVGQPKVFDTTCQRSDARHHIHGWRAVERRQRSDFGSTPRRRAQTVDTAKSGRHAYGAAVIQAQPDRRHAGGDSRGVASGTGSGGVGGVAGNGGSGISRLTVADASASNVGVTVEAYGGTSGQVYDRGTAGRGGDAEAFLLVKADKAGSAATGTASASGGSVNGARIAGGNSVVRSTVQADSSATSRAFGYGGAGDYVPSGRAYGTSDVYSRAVSNGAANAQAVSDFTSTSRVRAEAAGGTGPVSAYADAAKGNADVSAYSSALGSAANQAQALSRGTRGTVNATSVSTGDGGRSVTTNVSVAHETQISIAARTSASIGGALPTLANMNQNDLPSAVGSYATAHATAAPDAAALNGVLASKPNVAAALADGEVVGMGTFTGGVYQFSSVPTDAYSSVTSANFHFDTAAPGFLTLGLIDNATYGTGFTKLELRISDADTEIFSQSFDSLVAAQAFFSDHALTLGELGAGSHDLLVTAGFSVTNGQGFGFRYALGVSAVPEPQTWMLMLLGATVVLLRRRARG
jgi:hypothetical protein